MRRALIAAALLCGCDSGTPTDRDAVALTVDVWGGYHMNRFVDRKLAEAVPIGYTDDLPAVCGPDSEAYCGCFVPARQAIFLDTTCPADELVWRTIPHEMGHVLQWYEQGGKQDPGHDDETTWQGVVPDAQEALKAWGQ